MTQHVNSTKDAPAVVADRLAVVYDRSGQILHLHRVTTSRGGRTRTDQEVREAALENAKRGRNGAAAAEAEVLLVEPDALKPGYVHRVDVSAKALRAEPREY